MFDPEKFGQEMGAVVREAIAPLAKRISELEAHIAKPVDVSAEVEKAVASAVAALPAPKNGQDAPPVDVEEVIKRVTALIPPPKDGENGKDAKPVDTEALVKEVLALVPKPAAGKDGLGLAGAMIDRDGALQITLTNGEVKNLGPVVGKNGENGKDGLSLDGFEMEYLPEAHEIALKATAAGRVKELRYPAGGIRPAGYWREGTKAKAGEAWVHDGSLWIAIKSTPTKPATGMDDWIIAARKGRDGETTVKTINAGPPAPIKLTA